MNDSVFKRYWAAYGGFKALFASNYFYAAIVITALMFPAWVDKPWHDLVLAIMPNLLGFSLGGYALLIAIGDENFRSLISGVDEDEDGEHSPYMEVNSTFVHFILMQLISLVYALFSSAYYFTLDPNGKMGQLIANYNFPLDEVVLVGRFCGFTLFIYALLTALAATLAIFRVSSWYDEMHNKIQSTPTYKADQDLD